MYSQPIESGYAALSDTAESIRLCITSSGSLFAACTGSAVSIEAAVVSILFTVAILAVVVVSVIRLSVISSSVP